ncbi:MAG: small multi-drug export protein [Candidatus Eisenbacteria sp.]|nr:small multi-drug export protein [Candidatus Eisenbacteria bacterium]
MLPIVELRGAIPWALSPAMGPPLSWWHAYLISCVGNMVPLIPILAALGPVSDALRRRSRLMERFFVWLFARTRRRGKLVERYGAMGLILFVAIPLPVTGGWTGSAAAFVFGIPFRLALPCIALGVAIAGCVVTLAAAGVFHVLGL